MPPKKTTDQMRAELKEAMRKKAEKIKKLERAENEKYGKLFRQIAGKVGQEPGPLIEGLESILSKHFPQANAVPDKASEEND